MNLLKCNHFNPGDVSAIARSSGLPTQKKCEFENLIWKYDAVTRTKNDSGQYDAALALGKFILLCESQERQSIKKSLDAKLGKTVAKGENAQLIALGGFGGGVASLLISTVLSGAGSADLIATACVIILVTVVAISAHLRMKLTLDRASRLNTLFKAYVPNAISNEFKERQKASQP